MTVPFRIVAAGDASLIIVFDEPPSAAVSAQALAVADALVQARLPGVLDVVPTRRSVGVYLDPVRILPALETLIARIAGETRPRAARQGALIDVPVCYGGLYGPDLADLAAFASADDATVIATHAAVTYHVQMLGFAPGFAYLGDVDARIAMPRRAVPRTRVPAGSVGIAGAQTGVYPGDSPGGWQIIGRTPLRICDVARQPPFLFAPGDRVRFRAIDDRLFDRLSIEQSGV